MGSMISFNRPDGAAVQGYLAESAGARGAVVVIQEWWGLNCLLYTSPSPRD